MTEKLAPIVGYDPTLEELGIDGHLAELLEAEGLETDSQIEEYGDLEAIDGIGEVFANDVYAARKAWREQFPPEPTPAVAEEVVDEAAAEPAEETAADPRDAAVDAAVPTSDTAAPVEVVPPAEPAAGQIQYRLVKLRKAARVGNHQGEAGDTLALVELMPDVPLNFVVHALYNDLAGEESVETP